MISDYSRLQELNAAALDSSGASQKQFEKTLDSLESKMEKLKNAWHEFTMSILNSDLVKFGIDAITTFLEVINKATTGLGGFGDSLTKIVSVFAIFKMGSAIFKKLEDPIKNFLTSVIGDFETSGYKAGQAFAKGVKDGTAGVNEPPSSSNNKQQSNSKIGVVESVKETVGSVKGAVGSRKAAKTNLEDAQAKRRVLDTDIAEAVKHGDFAQEKKDINAQKNKVRQAKETNKEKGEIKGRYRSADSLEGVEAEEYEKLNKQYEELNRQQKVLETSKEDLATSDEELLAAEKAYLQSNQEMWESFSAATKKAGDSLITVGITMSALGGLMEQLGLEDVGEEISKIGQGITLVGSALSVLVPIIANIPKILNVISSHPVIAIVTAAIAVILIGIIAINKALTNKSPEKKLEKLSEAATRAAEAAEAAEEAYESLSSALDDLDEKTDALDKLTVGTKEWNDALLTNNNTVLDLISKYKELAEYVETGENGELTLDTESEEVQSFLKSKQIEAAAAKNNAQLASVAVTLQEQQVQFANLDATEALIDYRKDENLKQASGTGAAVAGTAGAIVGGVLGTMVGGPVGTAIGAAIGGAIIGAAGAGMGAIVGAIENGVMEQDTRSDEELSKAVEDLGNAVSKGEVERSEDAYKEYLVEQKGMSEGEAEVFSKALLEDDSFQSFITNRQQTRETQRVIYESAATVARQTADTTGLTSDQLRQGKNLVNGDVFKNFYQDSLEQLSGIDLANDTEVKESGLADELQKLITSVYGDGAKIENGKVTYTDEDGKQAEVTLTSDELRAQLASSSATELTAKAYEQSGNAINELRSAFGESVATAFDAENGGAITQADLEKIEASGFTNGKELSRFWETLSDDSAIKQVYGSFDAFKEAMTDGVSEAQKIFADGNSELLRDFMTADLYKDYESKVSQVGEQYGEDASNVISSLVDNLLAKDSEIFAGLDETEIIEKQQKIQAAINSADWTNQEKLVALQVELQNEYGVSSEKAKAFVGALGEATYATTNLNTTLLTYGESWRVQQELAKTTERVTDLQWKYNKALSKSGDSLKTAATNLAAEYALQAQQYSQAYNSAVEDLSTVYANAATSYGVDFRKYISVDENGNPTEAYEGALEDLEKAGVSKETINTVWESIEDAGKDLKSAKTGLQDLNDTIEDQKAQTKDSYYELRDMVKETVLGALQDQIDLQQETLDATRDANTQIISKLQDQINQQRQEDENAEARENISDLYRQQAYLMMDTSSGNSLDIAELEKQIQQAQDEYSDSLIDQAIQNLQDSNERAEEQRERQITLAQKQLEAYEKSQLFVDKVDSEMESLLVADANTEGGWQESELGKQLIEEYTEGMSGEEREDWIDSVTKLVNEANSYREGVWDKALEDTNSYLEDIEKEVEDLPERIQEKAKEKVVENIKTKATGAGFSRDSLDAMSEEELNEVSGYLDREGTTESTTGLQSDLDKHEWFSYKSASDYYSGLAADGANFSKADTYEQYLKQQKIVAETAESAASIEGINWNEFYNSEDAQKALREYISAGGTTEEFKTQVEAARNKKRGQKSAPAYAGATGGHNYRVGDVSFAKHSLQAMSKFATGGLVQKTGPAWLDGTPSKPEYVLNAEQTERFFNLVDTLGSLRTQDSKNKQSSGDSYFDIDITVEKMESDYDVEQVVDKIRSLIYADASYRNVNSVKQLR